MKKIISVAIILAIAGGGIQTCMPGELQNALLKAFDGVALVQKTSAATRTYNRNNPNQKLIMSNGQETPYFTVGEVRCKHGGNTCPETNFPFDSNLVDVLHTIRVYYNKPVIINSGYRCAAHNQSVGGAVNSNHLYGRAADIAISGILTSSIVNYALTVGAGADTYVESSFAHIAVNADVIDPECNINFPRPVRNLQNGSIGEDVKWLQTALNREMNVNLQVDGHFGNATETQVKAFQRKYGLTPDGIFGTNSRNKMVERLRI